MVRQRPVKNQPNARAPILRERCADRARREREVVRDAIRLRELSPSKTIEMMMELSDFCVRLGRGRKDG
jgi:hypothetical protein